MSKKTTLRSKKRWPFYFSDNLVKNQPNVIIFLYTDARENLVNLSLEEVKIVHLTFVIQKGSRCLSGEIATFEWHHRTVINDEF